MVNIDVIWMLKNIVNGIFEHRVGRWQGIHGLDGKETDMHALLVCFDIKRNPVQMLLYAEANYVGVYIRKGKEEWNCICYHDSCWRTVVGDFLFEHRADLHFSFTIPFSTEKVGTTIEHVTDAILVVALSVEQINEFTQIRRQKYN